MCTQKWPVFATYSPTNLTIAIRLIWAVAVALACLAKISLATAAPQSPFAAPPLNPQARLPADTLGVVTSWNENVLGLPELTTVTAATMTPEIITLGRELFFDGVLSRDGSVSCATCHQPDYGFASPDPIAVGIDFRRGKRNAPSLFNRGYGTHFFWDGRSQTLEHQSLQPLENQDEMGHDLNLILATLQKHPHYSQKFAAAFADSATTDRSENLAEGATPSSPVTAERLATALASFQRTLRLGNTEVDRFRAAEYSALSTAARQGLWIFESRGKCWQCHSGDNFTDESFHNTGVSFGTFDRDLGRFEITRDPADRFKFKTPSLRGAALTAPYMHDGSIASLTDVIEFYNRGGAPDDTERDPKIQPLHLSDADKLNLVEFLKALSR